MDHYSAIEIGATILENRASHTLNMGDRTAEIAGFDATYWVRNMAFTVP